MVPAGGSSRRMGADKLSMALGSSTVLGETLSRVPSGVPVVVVGPDRPELAGVLTAREDPPGGGPVAAIAAGLRALEPSLALAGADVVVVCAGDAPWSPLAVPAVVAALRAGPRGTRCAVALDAGGRRQVLLAAHDLAGLDGLLSAAGDLSGRSARWLVGRGALEVPVPAHLLADVDDPDQLDAARRRT